MGIVDRIRRLQCEILGQQDYYHEAHTKSYFSSGQRSASHGIHGMLDSFNGDEMTRDQDITYM